jgi:hypothetical protein
MAHDPHLADLMRSALRGRAGITEKKMFGGLCWLQHGNMLCGLTGDGRYMFRVGKAQEAAALARPGARPMDFTGRPMGGFVWVDPDAAVEAPMTAWIDFAAAYVGSLPPK